MEDEEAVDLPSPRDGEHEGDTNYYDVDVEMQEAQVVQQEAPEAVALSGVTWIVHRCVLLTALDPYPFPIPLSAFTCNYFVYFSLSRVLEGGRCSSALMPQPRRLSRSSSSLH